MFKQRLINNIFVLIIALLLFSCSDTDKGSLDEETLNKLIKEAKLTEFSGFYFVGNYNGRPSLYRYDRKNDKIKMFWNSEQERVINLITSPDYNSAFFITKQKQRLKSSQPAIERGRLYRINFELKKAEFITQLEDGIQIIAYWLDKDRFTLIINSIDKIIASYVNKNTQVYNKFGKLLSDKTDIFDLTKDGYPVTRMPEPQYVSPDEMFTIIEEKDSLGILQNSSNKEIKTPFYKKKVVQAGWAENKRNLILLLTEKKENKDTTEQMSSFIAVLDLKEKKTKTLFNNLPLKYFILIGDFLIFDSGIDKALHIRIFNLNKMADFKIIKLNGGCSIKNI
ncbi:MAG: hypothetical protein ROY99_01965 [Ignavibacterium sp.]|nr:hypothetical protein [Ignavibacterium sp.]